jgi:hypothetical protein
VTREKDVTARLRNIRERKDFLHMLIISFIIKFSQILSVAVFGLKDLTIRLISILFSFTKIYVEWFN